MSVEERARIDRRVEGFFWLLIVFAVVYMVLQVARTVATGGTLAPSDIPQPTSTTFPAHIVHMPTTTGIHIRSTR